MQASNLIIKAAPNAFLGFLTNNGSFKINMINHKQKELLQYDSNISEINSIMQNTMNPYICTNASNAINFSKTMYQFIISKHGFLMEPTK